MLKSVFKSVDSKDAAAFAGFFAADGVFRFGNLPEVVGADNIELFVAGFFDSIAGLAHEVTENWEIPGGTVCRGLVTYERSDSSELTVPFAVVIKIKAEKIGEYQVYVDSSQLYQ